MKAVVFGGQTEGAKEPLINLEPLHRFHSYCARFPSQVAEAAIDDYSKAGDSILDPFCGSGTSMVAGLIRGRLVMGADIDILAGMLSQVKCLPRPRKHYQRWRTEFAKTLQEAFGEIESEWPNSPTLRPGDTFDLRTSASHSPSFRNCVIGFRRSWRSRWPP